VTLNVPDEKKVEYFEIEDPNGKTEIFSKFEDGMVHFKFSGILPMVIWAYRVKIYMIYNINDVISVDVILSQPEKMNNVIAEVFTNVPDNFQAAESNPVKLFARIIKLGDHTPPNSELHVSMKAKKSLNVKRTAPGGDYNFGKV
jgi:hypothetical protein